MADFVASNESEGANVSALTTGTFACTGTDRVLCAVAATDDSADAFPTSATWNVASPESLARDTNASFDDGGYYCVSIWTLDDPTSATDDVTFNWATSQASAWIAGLSFDEADSTADGNANGTGNSVTVSNVVSGDMVLDCFIDYQTGAPAEGADQTIRESTSDLGGIGYSKASSSTQPGSAGGVMSYTNNNDPSIVALRITDAGGGGTTLRTLVILGAGV